MRKCVGLSVIALSCLATFVAPGIAPAAELPAQLSGAPAPIAWKLSVAALAAGQALDAYSSRGQVELNPLLRTGDGTYSEPKGIALKAGLVVGVALVERSLMRHHPQAARPFMWINFALAGASGAVAARNREGR